MIDIISASNPLANALSPYISGLWIDHIYNILICTAILAVFDFMVACRLKGRWVSIHAWGNLFVVLTCSQDAYKTLMDPLGSCQGIYNFWPTYFVIATHVYHLVLFKCTVDDLFHHFFFGGVLCGAALTCITVPISNFVSFFICGLPGGLDFLMLTLVKEGVIPSEFEKKWNARANVWLRAPGCMVSACFIFMMTLYAPDDTICRSTASQGIAMLVALLIALNGQYYCQVVTGNTFRKVPHYSC